MEFERVGLVPPVKQSETANANLETVLHEYLDDLRSQTCSAQYIEKTGLFIRGIAKSQRWKSIREIDAEGFISWRNNLAGKRAPKTLNLYLGALQSFLNWLVDSKRLTENPLRGVRNSKNFEQKRPRRACTDEEAMRLLAVAPPERRLIYLLALHTGLRRNEMETLEQRDLFLNESSPFIELRACNSKNRKGTTVWLHPEIAEALLGARAEGAKPSDRVVKMFPRLRAFKKDLAAAGIPFEDEFGRRFDLHAARKTFNTRMATNGIPTRVAMHAMRHSEERLTTIVYTDPNHLAVAQHVASLPRLLRSDQVSAIVSGKSASERDAMPQADTMALEWKPTEGLENQGFRYSLTHCATLGHNSKNGSGGWDRTNDLVVNSHPLCR